MATKEKEMVAKAAEADINVMESSVELSPEVEQKAGRFMDNYLSLLKKQTDAYVNRMAEPQEGAPLKAAGPMTFLGYQYWNLLTVGPVQFIGNPPWRPNKIIAAGELTLMLGVVWVNPAPDPGGGIPGTVALGGRPYRIRFETINLTNVTNGPDATFAGTFPPVPGIHFFPWFFVPGDPGPNPYLLQTHLTADITQMAQPFAAFGTWHLDVDTEPAFLGMPTQGPHWEHDAPCRYLVYRK
jgi:hypothetical protein